MNSSRKRNTGDRFIPLRLPQNLNLLQAKPADTDIIHNASFVNYARIRYNETNYENALKSVLLPIDSKILNFHQPRPFNPTDRKPEKVITTWPCFPRKKPQIASPDMILDMPEFDSYIGHHSADWSSNNCIAAIYECEVHLFDPNSEFRDKTETRQRARCCVKWHQSGTKFAMGLYPYRVGIWDVNSKKILYEESCCRRLCDIYTLDWLNEDLLLTGCSSGFVTLRNLQLKTLRRIRAAKKSIISMVVSCDGRYLATGSMEENVKLWKLPSLEWLGVIESPSNIRALAWHPWKASILAIGHSFDKGRVFIWNVNTLKFVATEKQIYKNSSVDALTFNPLSGELVVSYFVQLEEDSGIAIISVLADIDKVMEELHIHNNPVLYLMWGKNGNFLATAGGDEHLCIWKFFSKTQSKQNPIKRITKENLLTRIEKSQMFRPIR